MTPQVLIKGGGEMGERIRQLDWARTLLGPVAGWPPSLRTTVNIMLASRLPMMVQWGPKLVRLYNDGYAALLQGQHPGALGQPPPPGGGETGEVLPSLFDHVRAGDTPDVENHPVALSRPSGVEEAYFTLSYSPLYDEAGQVAGVLTTAIDTTAAVVAQRRQALLNHLALLTAHAPTAEAALRQVADSVATNPADVPFALLYLLDDAGPDASLVGSVGLPAGSALAPTLLRVPAATAAGWPLAEVVRTGVAQLVADFPARFGWQPTATAPAAPTQALVLPIARRDGRAAQLPPYAVLVVGLSPHRPLDAAYHEFCGLVAEYAGRAVELAHLRAHFEAVANSLQASFVVVNERGRITYLNALAAQLFEVVPAQLLGQPLPAWLPAGGPASAEVQHPGNGRWHQLTRHTLAAGAAYLLTEGAARKQAERGLQASLAQSNSRNLALRKANATLDTFVHIAAHDLQGPVNNLVQLLALQAAELPSPAVALAEQEVQRLHHTLQGMVRVLRTQHQAQDDVREVSFREVLHGVESELAAHFQAEQGQLSADFSRGETIVYIEAYLVSILKNLLHNALKYRSPERPPMLAVSTERQHDEVILRVQDNGLGIDLARYGARIFEPFSRLTTQASGLGLHLVNTIVEQNGGHIQVDSTLGQGTLFTIVLREYGDD